MLTINLQGSRPEAVKALAFLLSGITHPRNHCTLEISVGTSLYQVISSLPSVDRRKNGMFLDDILIRQDHQSAWGLSVFHGGYQIEALTEDSLTLSENGSTSTFQCLVELPS